MRIRDCKTYPAKDGDTIFITIDRIPTEKTNLIKALLERAIYEIVLSSQ